MRLPSLFATRPRFGASALLAVRFLMPRVLRIVALVAVVLLIQAGVSLAQQGQLPSLDSAVLGLFAQPNSIMGWVTLAVTLAAMFCSTTSTPLSTTSWGAIYQVIETVAFNRGLAKQVHPDEPAPAATPALVKSTTAAAVTALFLIMGMGAITCCGTLQQTVAALEVADPALASSINAEIAKADALLQTAVADVAADAAKAKPIIAEVCVVVDLSSKAVAIVGVFAAVDPATMAAFSAAVLVVKKLCADVENADTSTAAGDVATAIKAYGDIKAALVAAGALKAPAPAQ